MKKILFSCLLLLFCMSMMYGQNVYIKGHAQPVVDVFSSTVIDSLAADTSDWVNISKITVFNILYHMIGIYEDSMAVKLAYQFSHDSTNIIADTLTDSAIVFHASFTDSATWRYYKPYTLLTHIPMKYIRFIATGVGDNSEGDTTRLDLKLLGEP